MTNIKDKSVNEFAPFGNPDGSRADIEDILQGFITFGGSSIYGGLATKNDDLTVRVIVGRKGTGKTVYLRRLQAYSSTQDSLYADDIQQDLPTTENIIKFCQFFEENILTEKWMILWRRAIILSLISHLRHSDRLKEYANKEKEKIGKIIDKKYSVIIRDFGTPLSIYSQVIEIIQNHKTDHQVTQYLENPLWAEIESIVSDIIKTYPPICFYVDAVDEEFAHAPMYWQRCQKGLFYQTMRLLRDSKLGGRLHVIICIRDIVLSAVYQSEHRTRYLEEPHIRILNWNKDAIKYFLDEKIKMLDNEYFIGDIDEDGKNLYTWIGIKKIKNEIRNIFEPIDDYLLRHTRLLPRDIVILGNALCKEILKFKKNSHKNDIQKIIRDTMSKVSKFLGDEQLIICGNQISSDSTPKHAALHGYSEIYTAEKEFIRSKTEELKNVIISIGKDRFGESDLEMVQKMIKNQFESKVDIFSILWQNGLLGYIDKIGNEEKTVFYKETSLDDFKLPLNKEEYVFHSCMIDSVGIKPIGEIPISY